MNGIDPRHDQLAPPAPHPGGAKFLPPPNVPQWKYTPVRSAPPKKDVGGRAMMGVVGILIGVVLWLIGARYTIDGAIWIINAILAWFHIANRIMPVDGIGYVPALLVPIAVSMAEWHAPIKLETGRWSMRPLNVWVVWFVVVALDVLSTFFGLRTPDPHAWPIMQEVARSLTVSGILAVVLTFAGEWLIRKGLQDIWG